MFERYVFVEGLTSLFGSKGTYLININGQVKDSFGNDVPVVIGEDGHSAVHCSGWNGLQNYRVIDLVAIQFKGLLIPKEATGKVIIAEDSKRMAEVLRLDRKSVRQAAFTRGNQIYKGYRFRLGVTAEQWPDTPLVFKTHRNR